MATVALDMVVVVVRVSDGLSRVTPGVPVLITTTVLEVDFVDLHLAVVVSPRAVAAAGCNFRYLLV